MKPRARFAFVLFMAVISFLLLARSSHAQIKISFSNTVKQNVDPKTQQEIQKVINAGLSRIMKQNPAARDLFTSKQTIQIICFGEPKAKALGLKPDPKSPIPDYAMTHGNFGANGKPKKRGTAYIAVNCVKLKEKNWYFWWDYSGENLRMYDILLHEVLHATNAARRHPPDNLKIYKKWTKGNLAVTKKDLRKVKNKASKRRMAKRKVKKKSKKEDKETKEEKKQKKEESKEQKRIAKGKHEEEQKKAKEEKEEKPESSTEEEMKKEKKRESMKDYKRQEKNEPKEPKEENGKSGEGK